MAALYGVETNRLNEQVKRNIMSRFHRLCERRQSCEIKENQEGLERILLKNRHFDYYSVAIDSVSHSFEDSGGINFPIYVSVHRKDPMFFARKWFRNTLQAYS